jgi:hypothetical protein
MPMKLNSIGQESEVNELRNSSSLKSKLSGNTDYSLSQKSQQKYQLKTEAVVIIACDGRLLLLCR